VYLPLLLREKCIPESKRLDVALVIDASNSMAEDGGDGSGRSKLQIAESAATALLEELRLGQDAGGAIDRASVVSFNAEATVRQHLTQDRAALRAALVPIALAPGTQLDLGIRVATEELTGSGRRLGADRVMVILTDGRATGGPGAALNRADAAKALSVTIFTVGLGEDLDRAALVAIASRPELCTVLPTAVELVRVFQRIGRDLPCPPWTFWGGR
jgi:Mg-chelatase subunit ChlD